MVVAKEGISKEGEVVVRGLGGYEEGGRGERVNEGGGGERGM